MAINDLSAFEMVLVRPILVVFSARQWILDRLFESGCPFPFISRAAFAICADLVHGSVDLDLVTVGIVEFDARIAPWPAPAFVKNFNSLGLKEIANLEKLRNSRHLQGHMIKEIGRA